MFAANNWPRNQPFPSQAARQSNPTTSSFQCAIGGLETYAKQPSFSWLASVQNARSPAFRSKNLDSLRRLAPCAGVNCQRAEQSPNRIKPTFEGGWNGLPARFR